MKEKKETLSRIYVFHTSRVVEVPDMEGVILSVDAGADIRPFLDFYGDRVRQVHIVGGNGNVDSNGGPLPRFRGRKPVRKYFAQTKEEVIRRSKELKDRRWLVCPRFPIRNRRDVSFITSMGIAVDLLYRVDDLDEALMVEILKYYLHHPSLAVPVEPFHSMLIAGLEKKPLHLWSLHLLFPSVFLHVDERGIAGNPELLRSGTYSHLIDWNRGKVTEVKHKKKSKHPVDVYLKSLPRKEPACMSCAHFHTCFGWAKYQKDTCQKWKVLLDILQRNAREIKNTRDKPA